MQPGQRNGSRSHWDRRRHRRAAPHVCQVQFETAPSATSVAV